ncbi:hypothetical protein [Flagellimonas sp. SN16]|uniref:hypothetical protein n=1 Tax=Flagellimonas sp. SN16 TaxID=3415142 RepID=UPI003C519E8C
MTRREKEKSIWRKVGKLKNKAAYCNDAMAYLEEQGFNAMDGFSFYTNYICRKRLPNEKIKIDFLYDFTKDYTESTIGGKTETEKELGKVDAQ